VQFAARTWQVLRSARRAFRGPEAVLLRVPSHLANCLSLRNACYGVEILADPVELYAPGTSGTLFCGVYRAWFRRNLLRQGWKALARVFIAAITVDLIYEVIVFHRIYPGQSLIVATILALLPYPFIRGLVNRIARRWRRDQEKPQKDSRLAVPDD